MEKIGRWEKREAGREAGSERKNGGMGDGGVGVGVGGGGGC